MSSFLDLLPSNEQRKLRQRMRSPAEYERLRERVKGPEDLKREMAQNEALADLQLDAELRRMSLEKMKESIADDVQERGIDAFVEDPDALSLGARQALEAGKFTVMVEEGSNGSGDQIALLPQGNVNEKVPLPKNISDQYMAA